MFQLECSNHVYCQRDMGILFDRQTSSAVSKHLKGPLLAMLLSGILSFSCFKTLSVFSDPPALFKAVRCPLSGTVLAHKGFCRFPVSRHFPYSATPLPYTRSFGAPLSVTVLAHKGFCRFPVFDT